MADSNTCAAPPSASGTSPTTSPDHYSRPADSGPNYTLKYDEPLCPRLVADYDSGGDGAG
jgi:hypothetical protein